MTILHVTDFHFNKRWFDWLLQNAPSHDLLVMSGDMLDISSDVPHRKQIDWVSDWMNAYPGPMSVCSGNHDLQWDAKAGRWTPAYWLRDLANPNVWVDGQQVTFHGLSILNIGCTTRPKGGEADVWVVHAPPAGTLVSTSVTGGRGGDTDLAGQVRRYTPRLVLSGYLHNPVHWCERGEQTLHLNPGRDAGASLPNHILVWTDRMRCQRITADSATPRPSEILRLVEARTAEPMATTATAEA